MPSAAELAATGRTEQGHHRLGTGPMWLGSRPGFADLILWVVGIHGRATVLGSVMRWLCSVMDWNWVIGIDRLVSWGGFVICSGSLRELERCGYSV
ncbi:hypothetical protein M0R45_001693 [Rubus argutus]|uniref:Uncharacterized protein n=1 Tax=Rubus argutus TaxID=59490 RepID=A0AAW1VK51_RUBAR